MILAPSDIHFLKDTTNGLLTSDARTIADLSLRFQKSKEQIPKIQVAEKGGYWFALNNSYLHIIRDLERQGKCPQIRVEVVPLTKVPETVQRGMVVGKEDTISGTKDQQAAASAQRVVATEQPKGGDRSAKQENFKSSPQSQTRKTIHLASVEAEDDSYSSTDYSDYDHDEDDEETESEFEDALTCNVCDRSFNSTLLLAQHQQKKRHFGCSICNSSFPSLLALEHHKESLDHWSEDEGNTYESDSDDDSEDSSQPGNKKPEEMERLL